MTEQIAQPRSMIVGAFGVAALAAFFVLGGFVSTHTEPALLLSIEDALRGKSQLIAWWFTWLGYIHILAPLMIVSLGVGMVKRQWLVRAIVPVTLTILAWQFADFFQRHYHRARPVHWFVKHEHAFSYPSSHAAIAIAFYALWGAILWRSELPQRVRGIAAACSAVLTVGVIWSRIALGAHYVTDVTGGALLATGLVLLTLGLLAAFGISLWPRGVRALKVRTDPELPSF